MSKDGYTLECPRCNGSGLSGMCDTCDGEGVIPDTFAMLHDIGELRARAEAAEADAKRLREALTYVRDYADLPIMGDLWAKALKDIAEYAEAALAAGKDGEK